MRFYKSLVLILLALFAFVLFGCENKLDIDKDNGANISAYGYDFKVESNVNGLSVSLTEEEYQKVVELELKGEELKLPSFAPAAHDAFESKDDVMNPQKWYTAIALDPGSSAMDPSSMKHFESLDEMLTKNNMCYVYKYDYILSVSEELGDIKLKIDEVKLPDNNIVSIIFMGPDGYQEMESDGDYVSTGLIASSIKSGTPVTLSFILYVNGNDENCTTDKISKFEVGKGSFVIKLNVEKNQVE